MNDKVHGFLKRKKMTFKEQIEAAKKGEYEPTGSTTSALQKAMQSAPVARDVVVKNILLDDIYTEKQVRQIDEEKVLEYAATIRGSETGQPIQPIVLWANPNGTYLVIVGEHRYRAQLYNRDNYGQDYDHITAVIKTGECPQGSDRRRIQMQENLQHNPMSDIEIALVVREEMEAGTFDTLSGAVEWLHLGGNELGKTKGSMTAVLSQVFSLLDDPDAIDLVEAVHTGEMKPYKAKKIHSERLKEKARQEAEAKQAEVVSLEVKKANDRIAALEAQLEQSKTVVSKVEAGEGEEYLLEDDAEVVDEEEFLASERARQVDIEEQIEIERKKADEAEAATKAQAKTAEKKKPATPQRFSLDFENAISLLELLDKVAQDNDLEAIGYDPETIKRKQWDSIINDRLPEIIEALNSN